MTKTFKDAETKRIYQRERSRKLPPDIQRIALRQLRMINNSTNINDLRLTPANRLEKLSGDREGQYSIRIKTSGEFVLNGKMVMLFM